VLPGDNRIGVWNPRHMNAVAINSIYIRAAGQASSGARRGRTMSLRNEWWGNPKGDAGGTGRLRIMRADRFTFGDASIPGYMEGEAAY